MPSRRHVLSAVATATLAGLAGCSDGSDSANPGSGDTTGTTGTTETPGPTAGSATTSGATESTSTSSATSNATASASPSGASLSLSSTAFESGGAIPQPFSCDGQDASPPLQMDGVPDETAAFALVVDDPDAPREEPFVHWLIWNVPGIRRDIPPGVPPGPTVDQLDGARQGTNSTGSVGYAGPCPPNGDGPHTYRFKLYALDNVLNVDPGADRGTLESAVANHRIAATTLTGTYARGGNSTAGKGVRPFEFF